MNFYAVSLLHKIAGWFLWISLIKASFVNILFMFQSIFWIILLLIFIANFIVFCHYFIIFFSTFFRCFLVFLLQIFSRFLPLLKRIFTLFVIGIMSILTMILNDFFIKNQTVFTAFFCSFFLICHHLLLFLSIFLR